MLSTLAFVLGILAIVFVVLAIFAQVPLWIAVLCVAAAVIAMNSPPRRP